MTFENMVIENVVIGNTVIGKKSRLLHMRLIKKEKNVNYSLNGHYLG